MSLSPKMGIKRFLTVYWIAFIISTLVAHIGIAQDDDPNKRFLKFKSKKDSLEANLAAKIFQFDNINDIRYYYDKAQYNSLRKLNKDEKWDKLYNVLDNYVHNFGIENFYVDTYWLWRFAKLSEYKGEKDKSKLLYKLVLKHHREDIDIREVELEFDSLNKDSEMLYVPLDYYYELVEYRKQVDTLIPPRGILLNMGDDVNSKFGDYGPTLSIEDKVLLFTSKRNRSYRDITKLVANEDLFFTQNIGGFWTEAEPLSHINSPFNEGSACLSKDGKSIFFSRCNAPGGYGDCDLYVTYLKEDSTWTPAENLGETVNSITWDSHPSLSHGGDTLYFASSRMGGFGLSDIYLTYRLEDSTWIKPQNLGPIVNTRKNEVSPFLHPTHEVLYFSSNGHLLNFGEFDIFKTYKYGKMWMEPKNIGPLVNGEGSEYYFSIDSKSKDLFYARSVEDNMGNLDLHSFPLPMEAQPGATTTFKGQITDKETGEAFNQGIVSIIDLDNGIEVAPKFLRYDGTFEFDLINNKNYLLIIQGEEFFRLEELFFLSGDTEFHVKAESIDSKLKFESVNFDNGKADLKPEMYPDLDKVSSFLLDNPDFKLKISGHTDSDGHPEFNMKLSQARADAIRDYVILFGGIEDNRVEAKGYGSTAPIYIEEENHDHKHTNRRVEFEIIKPPAEERNFLQDDDDDW